MPSKLQRWTDVIAALLARKYPVTFDQLAREVPAYAEGLDPAHRESVKRMFERDKDELKAFGVPIEVVTVEEGESTGYRYRLSPKHFYLPYITLARESDSPHRPEGYRALPRIEFEPDEIETLIHALMRLDELGDPMLREDARATIAKIRFDVPIVPVAPIDVTILGSDRVAPSFFDALTSALRRRKSVTFSYRSPHAGEDTVRRVRPYGLFFVHAHWYLAALDEDREAVRNFRVSRMSALHVNESRPHTADFEIPPEFRLQEHARSRMAWDLGDGQPATVDVQFTGASGAARAAAAGGDVVNGNDSVRRFTVRRLDTFARWLLSLGGDAIPLSPPELVRAWHSLVHETLKVYDRD